MAIVSQAPPVKIASDCHHTILSAVGDKMEGTGAFEGRSSTVGMFGLMDINNYAFVHIFFKDTRT